MKKVSTKQSTLSEEILPEYNLSVKEGVRGKYYQAYQQGHTVEIRQDDGTVTVQYFTLQEGAVLLEPDVREYFPDSDSVNKALRSLIALIPAKDLKRTSSAKRQGTIAHSR